MAEWFDNLSAQQQHLYVLRHPKTKLKPNKEVQPISLPKGYDFDSKLLPVVDASKKAFESVDSYKDKILSFGNKKIREYSIRLKKSITEKDFETQKSVAGEILNKLGLLTIGAVALSVGVDPIVILTPLLLNNEKPNINIKGSPGQTVIDFIQGVFEGIKEGLNDPDRVKKALVKDNQPAQILIDKKPETSSYKIYSNPADSIKSFNQIGMKHNYYLASLSNIKKTKNIQKALSLKQELSSDLRKINMLFANNPKIDKKKTVDKLNEISSAVDSIIEQQKIVIPYIPKAFIEYAYSKPIQELTAECHSFIRTASIAKIKNTNYFVAVEESDSKEIVASISDIREQLPYLFKSYSLQQFRKKLKDIVKCN